MVEVDEADQIIFSRYDVDRACLADFIQILTLFYIVFVTGTVAALGIADEVAKKNYVARDWMEASIDVLNEQPFLLVYEGAVIAVAAVGILWWFGLTGASLYDRRQIRKQKAKRKMELAEKLAEDPDYVEPVRPIEEIFPKVKVFTLPPFEDETMHISVMRIPDQSQSSAD